MAESDIAGGNVNAGPSAVSNRSGSSAGGKVRTAVAARLGAKVTSDGVDALKRKFDGLLGTLRKVRTEMQAINNGGNAAGTGAGGSTNNNGGISNGGMSPEGFTSAKSGGFAFAATADFAGVNMANDRFARNVQQSVGISARDSLMSSRFGFDYRTAESQRFNYSGQFGGGREQQLQAQQIGFGFGQNQQGTLNFMQSAGNVVQASGGTLNIAQAAASASSFQDPLTMRRAQAMGIPMGRIGGQVQNPLQTAMGYLRDFEENRGRKLNAADFTNLQSRGNGMRIGMQRRYGLDDAAIDQVLQAGQQNLQFRQKEGRDINFNRSEDLDVLGLSRDRLGLQSQALSTVVGRRDASFFAKQEGAMVDKMGVDIKMQETLGDLEETFSGLLGTLHRFEQGIKLVTSALGGFMMLKGATGMLGGGGGGALGAAEAAVTGAPGTSPAPGVAQTAGGMGMAARVGLGAAGAALAFNGLRQASQGGGMNAAMGIAQTTAAGAMIGTAVPVVGTAIGAGVGAAAGGAMAMYSVAKGKDSDSVQKGRYEAAGMKDTDLIKSLGSYAANGKRLITADGHGAGPKERGRYDVWAARRGSLYAAMMSEANSAGLLQLETEEAGELGNLINFFSSDKTSDDSAFNDNAEKAVKYADMVREKDRKLYERYFGKAPGPFSNAPVDTPEYKSLIMSSQQITSGLVGGGTGDPVGDERATGTGAPRKGVGPGNQSWDKLDNRMKERIQKLMAASGGKVWVGQGWRDPKEQEREFLKRYYQSPDGDRTWQGKKWKKRPGVAPLASPGRSNHEIGLAADLQGDMEWLQQNAGKYGLKTFATVNNEPWHVQLTELQNGFIGAGQSDSSPDSPADTAAPAGDGGSGGGGGLNLGTDSGTGFSINAIIAAGGKGWRGVAASTTAGQIGGGVSDYTGGVLTAEQVAKMAYAAGFRGQALVDVVAIAGRESHYDPSAHNPNRKTGDNSYGLMQINMIDKLGPSRLRQFGLTSNEQLLDPMTNLKAAFSMYQSSGGTLSAWGAYKGKSNTYNTDLKAAAAAVAAAGITGDPVDSAMRPPFGNSSSKSGGVTITFGDINIQSSGNVAVDADAFIRAIAPKLEEAAGVLVKRTTG